MAMRDDDNVIEWRPVDPRLLATAGSVFRCSACGSMVVDVDRHLHSEQHAAA